MLYSTHYTLGFSITCWDRILLEIYFLYCKAVPQSVTGTHTPAEPHTDPDDTIATHSIDLKQPKRICFFSSESVRVTLKMVSFMYLGSYFIHICKQLLLFLSCGDSCNTSHDDFVRPPVRFYTLILVTSFVL
jgi:hypothetical protein